MNWPWLPGLTHWNSRNVKYLYTVVPVVFDKETLFFFFLFMELFQAHCRV